MLVARSMGTATAGSPWSAIQARWPAGAAAAHAAQQPRVPCGALPPYMAPPLPPRASSHTRLPPAPPPCAAPDEAHPAGPCARHLAEAAGALPAPPACRWSQPWCMHALGRGYCSVAAGGMAAAPAWAGGGGRQRGVQHGRQALEAGGGAAGGCGQDTAEGWAGRRGTVAPRDQQQPALRADGSVPCSPHPSWGSLRMHCCTPHAHLSC